MVLASFELDADVGKTPCVAAQSIGLIDANEKAEKMK